jgi:hypothetical protein
MDIPIKMIDFATATCWVFLIMFCVSAVYSVKDLGLSIGNPQTGITSDSKILFSFPVEIANNGFYDIGSFNFTTEVLSESGSTITEGSTLIPTIGKGVKLSILHNMTLDINRLLQSDQECLFNDTQLDTVESVGMKIGAIIPVQASGNFSISWGAPFHDFKLGNRQYSELNYTHTQVIVPMGFDNHAFFDVTGEILLQMYDNTGQLIGHGQTLIEAEQHSHYEGHIELAVATSITRTGRFELEFQTPLFSSTSKVIPYG